MTHPTDGPDARAAFLAALEYNVSPLVAKPCIQAPGWRLRRSTNQWTCTACGVPRRLH